MFVLKKGKTKFMYFPKTASTAFTNGNAVVLTSGQLVEATSSSTKLLGVVRKTVTSADSDYALTTPIPVEVALDDTTTWEATTASAVAADVGNAVDLTSAGVVNRGATSHKVVTIVAVISATIVEVFINSNYQSLNGA